MRTAWKRTIDVGLGTLGACLAIPVVLLLAVGVMLSLRTWPFFVQRRVGLDGRLIPVLKLRTLPLSTPRSASKYELADVEIPWFTQLLRRTHLDELPQLFLVPVGLMSLVGPRPALPAFHAFGDRRFADERTAVRPGCTGLWQISRASAGLIWEAPQYDRHYLEHASLGLDVWILWRTALLVVGLAPPVSLAGVPSFRITTRSRARAAATFDLSQ
jgi:lipopolysaccharide/colanic/teichoic acid biosynthesis glycosyltransferase